MWFRYVAWRDRRRAARGPRRVRPSPSRPPVALHFRVHDELDLDGFLQTGRKCSRDLPGRGSPRLVSACYAYRGALPEEYSEYVEVVRFLPKAMDGCQDIVILRRG
jgi:hypothetical protein